MKATAFTEERGRLALQMLAAGRPLCGVAAQLGVNRHTLDRWRRGDVQPGDGVGLEDFAREVREILPVAFRPVAPPVTVFTAELAARALDQVRRGGRLYETSVGLGYSASLLSTWLWQGKRAGAPEHLRKFARDLERARAEAMVAEGQAVLASL